MRHFFQQAVGWISVIAIASSCARTKVDTPDPPSYYAHAQPILQANCVPCHRSIAPNLGGMVAPFPLETYSEAKLRAQSIKTAVLSGHMPPWNVAPEYHGLFENERLLSSAEIRALASWVERGALEGNHRDAPRPVSPTKIGIPDRNPDLSIPLPREVLLADSAGDQYEYFSIALTPELLGSLRWIKAIELIPGSRAVHHASIIVNDRLLGAVAPGYQRREYPEGYGDYLRIGDSLMIEVHYHKKPGPGSAIRDQSRVALFFYSAGETIRHVVETETLGVWEFTIPPHVSSYVDSASYVFEKDYYLLWFTPHMHWRGKTVRFMADFPDGRRKELLRVPRYDFNWQHTYRLRQPVIAPKGTRVTVVLEWDNSAGNPANPDPRHAVRYGPSSSDEMGVGLILITEVQERSITVGAPLPEDLPVPRPVMRDMKHSAGRSP